MNMLAIVIASFPLGIICGFARVFALSRFGLVALFLFPVLAYIDAGALFFIGFLTAHENLCRTMQS